MTPEDLKSQSEAPLAASHGLQAHVPGHDVTVEQIAHRRRAVVVADEGGRDAVTGVMRVGCKGHAVTAQGHNVGRDPPIEVRASLGHDS